MKYLFILNDSPYGIERPYNGLRLASSLVLPQSSVVRRPSKTSDHEHELKWSSK